MSRIKMFFGVFFPLKSREMFVFDIGDDFFPMFRDLNIF